MPTCMGLLGSLNASSAVTGGLAFLKSEIRCAPLPLHCIATKSRLLGRPAV